MHKNSQCIFEIYDLLVKRVILVKIKYTNMYILIFDSLANFIKNSYIVAVPFKRI